MDPVSEKGKSKDYGKLDLEYYTTVFAHILVTREGL